MPIEKLMMLTDAFLSITDTRQSAKVRYDLVEVLVMVVCAVLSGADTLVEVELWAKEKLAWLRQYLPLTSGIPSHEPKKSS